MKYVGYIATFAASVVTAVSLAVFSMSVMAEPQEVPSLPTVDQSSVCVAASDEQALECPAGSLFMARLAINETDLQNPLILESRLLNTMALYCDTNFDIQHTLTGVLCVLTHERIGTPPENGDTIEVDDSIEASGSVELDSDEATESAE
ncbi:hypothetical protein M0220_10910 [Halomonas qinghailakensis]|uniref:Secreted protein n=2 Tax=Halomonas TaxID=2745 RepID=A0AA46YPC2_9GAMM|nr:MULTISPECIES: hypothetical protein [Halomonas]UYO73400.1 hypothetical protein M0220_10910 [Halomonas sp. ZZQ-149]UYV18509.1 hypothetical protein K1Y77_13660 [Halomonas qaidamensis]